MSKTPTYARFKQPIRAHEEINIHALGNLLSLVAATGPVEVAMGDGSLIPLDVGQTISFQEEEFDKIRILDVSGKQNSVDFYVGRGEFFDMRFSAQGDLRAVVKRTNSPDQFGTGAPVIAANAATTKLASANPDRVELMLVNDGASKVYVGSSSGAGAGQGVPLEAGQTLVLQTTSAAYVRNDSGAAVSVAVAQIGWS